MNQNRGGSCIDSPDWIKTTINPVNEKSINAFNAL